MAALFVSIAAFAADPTHDDADYATVDGASIKNLWINADCGFSTDVFGFFVNDGYMYFNNFVDGANTMSVINCATGKSAGTVSVEWGGYAAAATPTALAFVGNDSEGNCYIATRAWQSSPTPYNAFRIFVVGFSDGFDKPRVVGGYELTLGTVWAPYAPTVYGNLATGNFTLMASVWSHPDGNDTPDSRATVARWIFVGGIESSRQSATLPTTVCALKALASDLFIVDDRGCIITDYPSVYTVPTLFRWNDAGIQQMSTLDAPMDDSFGNGFDVFEHDGNWYIVYSSHNAVDGLRYSLARLTATPTQSLAYNKLYWTFPAEQTPFVFDDPRSRQNYSFTNVRALKQSDGNVGVYLHALNSALAAYTVSLPTNDTTEAVVVEAAAADSMSTQCYTIDGRYVAAGIDALLPGMYIIRTGSAVRKVLVR